VSLWPHRYGNTKKVKLTAGQKPSAASLAVTPALAGWLELEYLLERAIKDVIDLDLFNQESAAEQTDSSEIIAVQNQAQQFFRSLNLG
jgi:hypothetical protein